MVGSLRAIVVPIERTMPKRRPRSQRRADDPLHPPIKHGWSFDTDQNSICVPMWLITTSRGSTNAARLLRMERHVDSVVYYAAVQPINREGMVDFRIGGPMTLLCDQWPLGVQHRCSTSY